MLINFVHKMYCCILRSRIHTDTNPTKNRS